MSSKFWQWYDQAKVRGSAAGVSISELDWLVRELAGVDRLAVRLQTDVNHPPLPELDQLWQKRLHQRVPIQYLVGRVAWRDFELKVTPAVLIPRPETEQLVDLAAARARPGELWADLGTGSGAIALGLARLQPALTVVATDISAAALAVAQHNAQQLGLGERLQFSLGSWFEALSSLPRPLDGLVSNPPYIPAAEVLALQPEVAQHEPRLALDGGPDGLACLRHLVEQAPAYLRRGGQWLVEVMAGQAPAVAEALAVTERYAEIEIQADWAGIERFVVAVCRDSGGSGR